MNMAITDTVLNKYKKLGRNKNTWGFSVRINSMSTKFLIEKFGKSYIVSIKQMCREYVFEDIVCLGVVKEIEDLEQMFKVITRGEILS